MRNGQSTSKSVSHTLPNSSASASVKESSDNVKVSKRMTDRSASSLTQKSESSGVVTSSVVKKTDGTVSSNNADNMLKKSSLNNHDDDNSSLRRSNRISASSDPKKSFIDNNISPVPAPVPVPPRKRKDRDLNDSKLSSASASQNSKAVKKGKALSIEVLSGISQHSHAKLLSNLFIKSKKYVELNLIVC